MVLVLVKEAKIWGGEEVKKLSNDKQLYVAEHRCILSPE